ncbi:MAG: ABC transporter permease [Chloroflexi bacterium]|nr:ABC transporter permease [Chloroflexota bacterium]
MLLLWELLVRAGALDQRFFPPPTGIVGTFGDLLVSGALYAHVKASLLRLVAGFLAAAVPAVALGLVMGLSRPVRLLLMPAAAVIYPVPKIAIVPLIMLIFSIGETSKIVTVAITVFFLVLLNTTTGVLTINPIYLDVARNFGASRLDVIRTVALPGALPLIFAGLKLGLGLAWTVVVGAEFLGSREGIGFLIWQSYQTFAIEALFVGLLVTSVLGWLSLVLLDELERRFLPWSQSVRSA